MRVICVRVIFGGGYDQNRAGGELHALATDRSEKQTSEPPEPARSHHEHERRGSELGEQLRRLGKGGSMVKGDPRMPRADLRCVGNKHLSHRFGDLVKRGDIAMVVERTVRGGIDAPRSHHHDVDPELPGEVEGDRESSIGITGSVMADDDTALRNREHR